MRPRIIHQSTSLSYIINNLSNGILSIDIDDPSQLWITNIYLKDLIPTNTDNPIHIKPMELEISEDNLSIIVERFKPNVKSVDSIVYDYVVVAIDDGNITCSCLADLIVYNKSSIDELFGVNTWSLIEMTDKDITSIPIIESTELPNDEGLI